MKKQLTAVMLAVLALLSAMSPAFGAAETDSACEGAGMTVTAGIDDHKQVVVTWNMVTDAYYYLVSLYNDSPSDHTFHRILSEQSVGSWNSSTIFLGNYIECYASGGPNYKAIVKAMDKNNQILAQGSSENFQTGITILETPEVILNPNGLVSCSTNENAIYYDYKLFDSAGNQIDRVIGTGGGTRACNFPQKMTDGKRYYVTVEISNISMFRSSAPAKSNVVTANTVKPNPWPTLNGKVKSFLNESDKVTVKLEWAFFDYGKTQTLSSNNANFSFTEAEPRNYFLIVSKKNHATRTLTLPFSTDETLNIQINPLGDINGDGVVNVVDYTRVNAHVRNIKELTGYELQCADVIGSDGAVQIMDAARINAHVRGVNKLW